MFVLKPNSLFLVCMFVFVSPKKNNNNNNNNKINRRRKRWNGHTTIKLDTNWGDVKYSITN